MDVTTFLLSLLPGIITGCLIAWLIHRRERRLLSISDSKLRVAKAVTEMERYMLSGRVTVGTACHDVLFKAMIRIQLADDYQVRLPLLSRESEELRSLKQRLQEEVGVADAQVRETVQHFIGWHLHLYRFRHPFKFAFHVLWLLVLCGGAGVLLAGLKGAHFGMRSVCGLRSSWVAFKNDVARSLALRIAPSADPRHAVAPGVAHA